MDATEQYKQYQLEFHAQHGYYSSLSYDEYVSYLQTIETPSPEEEDVIKTYSYQQRMPREGEPVCVVCGRYGEYICDNTEQDVCSMECKEIAMTRASHLPPSHVISTDNDNLLQASKPGKTNSPISMTNTTFSPVSSTISEIQLNALRTELDIKVSGTNVSNPILEFSQCNFDQKLVENMNKVGYTTPTPIQMQAIPVILAGRDLLASAPTGSGKTAAFVLPAIVHVEKMRKYIPVGYPSVLILAPTRELSMQIEGQVKSLVEGIGDFKTALIVGGLPLPPQLHRLHSGVQIIIATPGRLLEVIAKEAEESSLSYISLLVVDEVDAMLKMGFRQQVDHIKACIPNLQQRVLMSATIPASVENLSKEILENSVLVAVGNPGTGNTSITQLVMWVEEREKKSTLLEILQDEEQFFPPVVVFVGSRIGAEMLATTISTYTGMVSKAIHGEKTQQERSEVLNSFLKGEFPVLVATGILGRGLDLLSVTQVIQFDLPSTIEEYIHQIGRAGRLGMPGVSIAFVNATNKSLFPDLYRELMEANADLPIQFTEEIRKLEASKSKKRKR